MTVTAPVQILTPFRTEMSDELSSILNFWIKYAIDKKQGGFIGRMDNNAIADTTAAKGVVLNSRILWTFSAAYQLEKNEEYLKIAARAYQYIVDHFIDRKYGGVYWSVDNNGAPLDPRKQIYGLAFCIYGLSEYYKVTGENMALHLAKDLVDQIEKNSFDHKGGGYLEAFTQGWKILGDLRLSEKDDNEKKTANTHLHIVEAYANLYTVWPDEKLKESIKHLLDIFEQYMIDPQTAHLNLFMDENWTVKSSLVSYGHDIEAAWLLLDCARKINSETYIIRFKELSIRLAKAAAEGLDKDGGLWYEYDAANNQLIMEKHWWPQAEAMVGFLNAYELTGQEKYLQYFINSWEFIKQYIKDNENGEWFWGVDEKYAVMDKEKAGFWKCPYHNARACMEIFNRI